MLVITRKEQERIYINVGGKVIVVYLVSVKGKTARIGFDCDKKDVSILRFEKIKK